MHCILETPSLKQNSWLKYITITIAIFICKLYSSSSHSSGTPTKMSNMPFKDAKTLAGSVRPIAGEDNQLLFNTTHCLPWRGQHFCKACNKSFKHYKGTVHNSLQKSRVLFKMRDLLKKSLVQDAAVISRSAYPKLCFHAQNVLFPCKCLTDYWYCFQEGSAATLEGKKYGLCLERV